MQLSARTLCKIETLLPWPLCHEMQHHAKMIKLVHNRLPHASTYLADMAATWCNVCSPKGSSVIAKPESVQAVQGLQVAVWYSGCNKTRSFCILILLQLVSWILKAPTEKKKSVCSVISEHCACTCREPTSKYPQITRVRCSLCSVLSVPVRLSPLVSYALSAVLVHLWSALLSYQHGLSKSCTLALVHRIWRIQRKHTKYIGDAEKLRNA